MSKAKEKKQAAIHAADVAADQARADAAKAKQKAHEDYLKDARIEQAKTDPLGGLRFAGANIPAFKVVRKDGNSAYGKRCGKTGNALRFSVGEMVIEPNFNTNEEQDCGAGINVATLAWILKDMDSCVSHITGAHAGSHSVLRVTHSASDIVAIPFTTQGKYRVKRCFVEADITEELVATGLMQADPAIERKAKEEAAKAEALKTGAFVFDGNYQVGDIVRFTKNSSGGYVQDAEYEVTAVHKGGYASARLCTKRVGAEHDRNGWLPEFFTFVRRPSATVHAYAGVATPRKPGAFCVGDKLGFHWNKTEQYTVTRVESPTELTVKAIHGGYEYKGQSASQFVLVTAANASANDNQTVDPNNPQGIKPGDLVSFDKETRVWTCDRIEGDRLYYRNADEPNGSGCTTGRLSQWRKADTSVFKGGQIVRSKVDKQRDYTRIRPGQTYTAGYCTHARQVEVEGVMFDASCFEAA